MKKTVLFILFSLSVIVAVAQDKMVILPDGSTVPEWVAVSSIAGGSRPWEFNVVDYGAVGDGTTDDTNAFQDAFDAAIAYDGGVVIIPQAPVNWTITSTITVDDANDSTRVDVWAVGGDHNDISYEGANNTALFAITQLYNSTWTGINATILDGRSGVVLIDIYGNSESNTFKDIYLNLGGDDEAGTAAGRNEDCIGMRWGATEAIFRNYQMEHVTVTGGNDDTADSPITGQYAFQNLSGNCRNLVWFGGMAQLCDRAFSNVTRDGSNRGDAFAFFYGFNSLKNNQDFTFTVEGPYLISGGFYREGNKFLVTSTTGSLQTVLVENIYVRTYLDDDDIVNIGTTGSIVFDNCSFIKSSSSVYTSVINLSSTSTSPGTLTIKGSSFALSSGTALPYVISGTTVWQVSLIDNMRMKNTSGFLQPDTHFANSSKATNLIEDIAPEVKHTSALVSMNNAAAGVSELRWLEDSDNGTNYFGLTVNSTLAGNTVYTLPTAFPAGNGYSLTSTTAGVMSWSNISAGGITNTAAANEIPKSDGTNIVPSGVFSNTESNLTLGSGSISGASRVISTAGSATNIGLYLGGKAEPVFAQNEFAVYDVQMGFTLGNEVGNSIYITADEANHTLGGGRGTNSDFKDFDIKAATGIESSAHGRSLNISAGNAFNSGNLNGGNIVITSGAKNGSGTDGNITIDSLTGYLIISTIPTSSAGLPSGAVWANSNVLTIVP